MLFNRSYLLKVSSPTKLITDPKKPYNLSLADAWTDTAVSVDGNLTDTEDNYSISKLRIKAKIASTISNSNSNYTEILVYNVNKEIKEQLKQPNSYLTLSAGYSKNIYNGRSISVSDLPVIFVGDIVESYTKKVGADFITTIRAKDSEVMKRDMYVSKYYVGGRPLKDILKDLVNSFMPKVTIGRIDVDLLPVVKKLNFAYLAYGKVSDVLDELAKDFNFIWYITGNRFYATLETAGRAKEFVHIYPSVVIGDVQEANSTNNSTNADNNKAGLKVKLFLDGRIDTSKFIRISGFSDDTKNGDFKIVDLSHSLDSRGENWFTELTLAGV